MTHKYQPYYTKVLQPNHRFALLWEEGATFHRVIGVDEAHLTPYVESAAIGSSLIPEATNPTSMSSRTSVVVRDTDGNYLEDVTSSYKDSIIQQIFYGFNPPWLRIFPSYPADRRVGKILSFPAPSTTSEYGYIMGEDSPFETPTEAGEFWFPYKMRIMFDFVNPRVERKAHPTINAIIYKYRVQNMDPRNSEDSGLIARMARGDAQVYWVPLGPSEAPKSFDLTGDWPVRPIKLDQAKALGGGR